MAAEEIAAFAVLNDDPEAFTRQLDRPTHVNLVLVPEGYIELFNATHASEHYVLSHTLSYDGCTWTRVPRAEKLEVAETPAYQIEYKSDLARYLDDVKHV
jgi:hypothetical protein